MLRQRPEGPRLAARSRQQEVVARLGRESLAGLSSQELGSRIARALAAGLGMGRAALFRAEGVDFVMDAACGWDARFIGRAVMPLRSRSVLGECFAVGEAVVEDDLRRSERFRAPAFLKAHGMRAVLCVRVMAGPRAWGVLSAHGRQRRAFSAQEMDYALALANLLGESLERLERLGELERAVRDLETAIEIAGLARAEADARTGRITATPEFLRLHGVRRPEEMKDLESYWKLIHPEDRARLRKETQAALLRGDLHSFEGRILRPDGAVRHFVSAGRVERDGSGAPVRLQAIMRDVTAELQAREAEALRRRDAEQREFLANVSHEFRTPLAAIQGFAETLLAGALDDRRNRTSFVRSILEHSRRLSGLVEGLLDLAALEGRRVRARRGEIELAPLVRSVMRGLSPVARRAGVRLRAAVPAGLSVRGDSEQLARVLTNLLSNAVDYNRKGGRAEVSAAAEGGRAVVAVRDTGMGIAPEQLDRVFQRFHRTPRARAAKKRGSGLGLAIARGIVEAHGGRIWAESRMGSGSTFRFSVPLAARR